MGARLTVACKLPHGLRLRVFKETLHSEPVIGGGMRDVATFLPDGPQVVLNGNAVPYGRVPNYTIIGGYALTPNVDADFFNKWLAQNKDSDVVRNALVFAFEKLDGAVSEAKSNAKLKSGLEPLDVSPGPKGVGLADPRVPKGANKSLSSVASDDRAA